jgi:O-antigen/teichoic acid export membrane protein
MKRRPLASRIFFGTLANAVGQAAVVLGGLVVVPVVVHHVGVTDYAIWAVIVAAGNLVQLVELGISDGLVKFVAEEVSRERRSEAALMIGAATWNYAVIGLAVVLAGFVLAAVVPDVLGLHGHRRELVPALIIPSAIAFGLWVPSVAPLAVLRGLERFSALNAVRVLGALLEVVLTVVLMSMGAGIVAIAWIFVTSTVATYVASVLVVRRVAPDLWTHPIRRDRSRLRRLLRFSVPVALVEIVGRVQTRLDTVIIAAVLPIRAVAPYTFAQRLADGTRITTEQFVKVLLPVATEVSTTRDPRALRGIFLTATRLSAAIALAVALPLALLGGPTLALWVGSAFRDDGDVVAILAISAIFDLCLFSAAAVLQSIERHGPLAKIAVGGALANVVISIALVTPFGVVGVALGTLIASSGATLLFALPYAARTLGVPLRAVARQVLLRLSVPALVFAAALEAAENALQVTSIARLLAVVVFGLICYALAYMLVGAGASERLAYRSAGSSAMRWLLRPRRPGVSRA